MHWLKLKALLVATAALFVSAAVADIASGQPVFNWQPPTQYENGAPLNPATDLQEYQLTCEKDDGVTYSQAISTATNSWQAPAGFFPSGQYACWMVSVDKNGTQSENSVTANLTMPVQRPAPMITFTVE